MQRPQHTHGPKNGGIVFFVSAHEALLCNARDVTQQCVAITWHVFSVMRFPCRGYITSLLVARRLDWRFGSEFRS
jgi:hypothetical protein